MDETVRRTVLKYSYLIFYQINLERFLQDELEFFARVLAKNCSKNFRKLTNNGCRYLFFKTHLETFTEINC